MPIADLLTGEIRPCPASIRNPKSAIRNWP